MFIAKIWPLYKPRRVATERMGVLFGRYATKSYLYTLLLTINIGSLRDAAQTQTASNRLNIPLPFVTHFVELAM